MRMGVRAAKAARAAASCGVDPFAQGESGQGAVEGAGIHVDVAQHPRDTLADGALAAAGWPIDGDLDDRGRRVLYAGGASRGYSPGWLKGSMTGVTVLQNLPFYAEA